MLKATYLFICLFVAQISIAQNATIQGYIHDNSSTPVDYANVMLLNVADSTLYKGGLSEAGGLYTFTQVKEGSYIVHSSMVGFGEVYSDPINSDGKSTNEAPTLILSQGVEIAQVTVTAKKPFIELRADKLIVNVANSAVNAGNTALEVLEKSPGVIVDNNNNISLRGKQGVLVTINGKNQYMSGTEITRLLETMPSSNIESIEIITNPSAKFDAEGNSGIINIVLKKNEKLGSNGNVSSSLRQGWKTSHFHNLNLNYRSDKINVYGATEYYNWGWKQKLNLLRDIPFNEGNTVFDQNSVMDEEGDGYNIKLGMDWSLTDNTTLSLLARRNAGVEIDENNNMTNITGDNAPAFSKLAVLGAGDEDYSKNTYNANITHTFNDKGLKLTLDADVSRYTNGDQLNYSNFYRNESDEDVADPFYLRNMQETAIDIFATTADLDIPVSDKVKLGTGIKFSDVNSENSTRFEHQEESEWVNESERSNTFMYAEKIYATYLNGSASVGTYQIQAGIRLEHTESEGRSITLGTQVPRSYTNLFPSVSVSKAYNEKHNVSLSYSRRLERPNYRSLNPFEDYLDQYTFEKGNPFLNPQYSHALGLNYMMGRSLFVSINYSRTTDAITEVIEQISSENKTFQTEQNLDGFNNISLTLSAPKVWSETFTSRFNYTTFYNDFKSVIPSGTLDNQSIAHVFKVDNEIQLPRGWNIEVSGEYQSKLQFGLFRLDPKGGVDLGISKRFLDGKCNLKIGVSDIFYTTNSKVSILQDDINLIVDQDRDSRRVKVSVSYAFGNQKVKAARKRKTATEAEQGRI